MKKIIVLLLIITGLFSCNAGKLKGKLIHVWTAEGLKTPESVMYYKAQNILFVSNIDGKPAEKDNKGSIAKISLKGKVLNTEWIKELNAPKGMGIHEDFLYVTDIDRLVKIDIKNSKIAEIYPVENAKFLNDIAVADDGTVYFSDMHDDAVYTLKDGKINLWIKSNMLTRVNGLFVKEGALLAGTAGKIMSIDISSKEITPIVEDTGNIDGLKAIDNDNYIISDWAGKVQLVNAKEKKVLSDTTEQKINAADFEYISSKKMLYIPTFFDNKIAAYKLK